jgi:hypothetical protein
MNGRCHTFAQIACFRTVTSLNGWWSLAAWRRVKGCCAALRRSEFSSRCRRASSARYRLWNSGQRFGSWPNHCCSCVLGARSVSHASAFRFRTPAGQFLVASTRWPSEASRGSWMCLMRTSSLPSGAPAVRKSCRLRAGDRPALSLPGILFAAWAGCLYEVLKSMDSLVTVFRATRRASGFPARHVNQA